MRCRCSASKRSNTRRWPDGARGQTLVEFALVFPLFMIMLLGVIEFAFVFNAMLSVNYASRDAALVAAEAGDGPGADCIILAAVETAIGPPTSNTRIKQVEIYRASANGVMLGTPTIYRRTGVSGATTCTFVNGSTTSAPYDRTADGYPVASRCNLLGGCDDDVVGDTVDNVGVRVTYTHSWITPLRNFIGGDASGLTFDRSSVMRMEPIL